MKHCATFQAAKQTSSNFCWSAHEHLRTLFCESKPDEAFDVNARQPGNEVHNKVHE